MVDRFQLELPADGVAFVVTDKGLDTFNPKVFNARAPGDNQCVRACTKIGRDSDVNSTHPSSV